MQIVQIFAHLPSDRPMSHTLLMYLMYIFGYVYNWFHTLHVCMYEVSVDASISVVKVAVIILSLIHDGRF